MRCRTQRQYRGRLQRQEAKQRHSRQQHCNTDPQARLFAKSHKQESLPAYLGHVLMENRSKLAVDTRVTLATGTAEHEAAIAMLRDLPGEQRKTVGADKNFDTAGFVTARREMNVTPHVAQNAYEYDTKTGKRAKRSCTSCSSPVTVSDEL